MTARPIRHKAQVPDRNGKIFYTSITSLSHISKDSLDQAMKALSSLADGNRLVGIISHVADLKNRIDKQIVVTKEKSGGSKANIVV